MKYIGMLLIAVSVGLIGCTTYQPSYYDVSAEQWQNMPSQRQTISIYAYNTEQKALAEH